MAPWPSNYASCRLKYRCHCCRLKVKHGAQLSFEEIKDGATSARFDGMISSAVPLAFSSFLFMKVFITQKQKYRLCAPHLHEHGVEVAGKTNACRRAPKNSGEVTSELPCPVSTTTST